jgi:glycine cleavage system aminomethyltransferase T
VFGEVAGWERANWFAREGQEREYRYDWGRQNWFENQRAEHMAVRQGVGLFDMTSFGKIRVEGRDACAFLQRVCANDVDVAAGRIVYTQMLNDRGGIESDLTVTRLSETAFLLVVPGATLQRDLAWLRRHLGDEFVVITDVTAAEAVLCLMGPQARDVLARVTPDGWTTPPSPSARRARSRWASASPARTGFPMSANWGGSFTSAPTRPRMCSRR